VILQYGKVNGHRDRTPTMATAPLMAMSLQHRTTWSPLHTRSFYLTVMLKNCWWHIATKITVFWAMMLYCLIISYTHIGAASCLHLLGGPKCLKTTVHPIPQDCNFHQ
jgi:hypothetical protein